MRPRQDHDIDRPLFMISVAAELAGMHPQTLRMYERRGLVLPQRTAGKTRRYSERDVERLRRIQELTDVGLNLAGVERVLAMEKQLETMRLQMQALQEQLDDAADAMRREVERIERSHRMDLVPVARGQVVHIGRRRRHG
jgi:MerR family transcriptional regulator, heat shock protein HspR